MTQARAHTHACERARRAPAALPHPPGTTGRFVQYASLLQDLEMAMVGRHLVRVWDVRCRARGRWTSSSCVKREGLAGCEGRVRRQGAALRAPLTRPAARLNPRSGASSSSSRPRRGRRATS
jgi:hypothetical protein